MLGTIDARILSALQHNARLSNVELAALVRLSPAACQARVHKLQEAGYILHYRARLNPALLDMPLIVFIEVTLDRSGPDPFGTFRKALADIPDILECYMVTGRFDFLIKVRVKAMSAYRDLLGILLATLQCVQRTHARVVLEEIKATSALPLPALRMPVLVAGAGPARMRTIDEEHAA